MTEPVPRPALRARWTHALLDKLDELTASQRAELDARLGRTKLEYLAGRHTLDWVLIEDHLLLLQALSEVLGIPDFLAYVRRAGTDALRSPFLRGIAITGVRVFGRAGLLRVLPRAWKMSLRSCGSLRVERDAEAGVSRVIIRDMPEVLEVNEPWRLGIAATLASTLDLGGYIGRVRVDEGTFADGELRYIVTLVVEPEDDPGQGESGVSQTDS